MLLNKIERSIRLKKHGTLQKDCRICGKTTSQLILEQRPLNWFILGFIPIPYNSSKYNIWYKCKNCDLIVGFETDDTKEDVLESHKSVSKWIKEDVKMQIEVCDVCYFECNKKISESTWNHRTGNIILHLCEKHKEWITEQKEKGNINTHQELIKKISSWYS